MSERLMEEAEALVRSGVRRVSAERLRGQVQVLHWSSVRQAFGAAMDALRTEVERLSTAAAAQEAARAVTGETPEQKAARLEKEVRALRERLAQYEEACDALDLIEDFDLAEFEATAEALLQKAELTEAACAKKGKTISLKPKVQELLPDARDGSQLLDKNLGLLFEGAGDMQVFLTLVKLGRKFLMLRQRMTSLEEMMNLLTAVAS